MPGPLGGYISIGNFSYTTPKSNDLVSWIEIRGLHYFLNNSFTENNTWFIAIVETSPPPSAHPSWHYVDDSYNGDNSYAYHHQGGPSRNWGSPQPYDFTLILTFNKAAKSTIPNSAEIGLKINGSDVIGTNGQGTWNSSEIFGSNSGELQFKVTATWEDVECNITLVQINYTKTNLKASSAFKVKGSGQDILWNVTRSNGFNLFDDRLEGYRINFTIPDTWNNINVFNGDKNKTDNISSYSLSNGYKIIEVLNAGNGTYWFLNATSFNLLKSIDTYVGQTSTNIVNITNIVHFNATFYQFITQDDGTLNLYVYSPAAISNKLNYSSSKSTFNSATEISIVDWDISDNATHCGAFRAQILWNNDTAAGFLEKILTITCDTTELIITDPPQDSEYNPEDVFNITVYFNDTAIDHGIDGATIDVDVNGTTYNTDIYDLLDGYYKIKINCSDPEFGLGLFAIGIKVIEQYYYNQSEILNIKITIAPEAPSVAIETPSDGSTVDNTADIEINANITDDDSVSSGKAMINASTPFNISMQYIAGKWTCIWDNTSEYGVGDYKITIWAIDNEGIVNQTEYVTITLNDVINPSVTIETPSDGSSHDNTVNIEINATIIDKGSFILSAKAMINTTIPFNITMQNIASIWTCTWENISLYDAGDYKITIWTIDDNNNINQTEFVIITIIDIIAPTWDETPTDQTVELGTSFIYDLNATDLQSVTYSVNDTTNFAMDASGVLTNNTLLTVGSYPIEVTASDGTNDNTTVIIITVQDTIAPTWDEMPQDQTVELGQSFSYDLNATDLQSITYSVNDTTNFAMDASGVLTNNTALSLDSYSIEVTASDDINDNKTIITITVEDTISPTWVEIPTSQGIFLGQPFSYDLNATDLQSITYSVNDTVNFTIDGNGVLTNNTVLSLGAYSLEINATDASNNVLTRFITVSVTDTVAPTWDETPQDQTIEFGSSFSYDLNATDLQSVTYSVNDTINFAMDGNGILTNNTLLTIGSYPIEVTASDGTNDNTTVIIITVQDTIAPIWDETPQDQTIEFGSSFSYDLNATDLQSVTYSVNDTINFAIDGNGVLTNITVFSLGSYPIEVTASDGTNDNITVIIITIEDTTAPEWIETPTDQTVELGQSFSYELNATDLQSITYSVNDTVNFTIDGNGVLTNNTALNLGSYSLEINATDASNNVLTVYIIININDTMAPIWDKMPQDQFIEFGSSFSYDLNATDLQSVTYSVNDTINFAMYGNGVLTNNTVLTVDSYPIKVTASDGTNDNITIIIINVQDTIAPIWDETPQDQTIELGNSFNYEVNASDLSGIAQYWVNDTINFQIDGSGVITNATALSVGIYWLIINASDPYDNNCSRIIKSTVEHTINPPNVKVIIPSSGSSFTNTADIEINATITDDGSVVIVKAMINATTRFNITMQSGAANKWTCTWDNVSLYDVGDYKITIWAKDDEGSINQTEFVVITLNDDINPSVIILSPSDGSNFNNNEIIEINATITDIGSSISSVKTIINASTPFNISMSYEDGKWTCIWDNTSQYDAGDYKIMIWAIDEYGNINQTEQLSLKLIGLTSLNILNITQYNQLIQLNDTVYEAFFGENLTIYMNYINLYPSKLITGAFGNLTFNGVSYYDYDLDNNGLYYWEINTSQLSVGNYNFSATFSKIYYQNITVKIKFDINKLPTQINIINQPNSVKCGEKFNITINLINLITGGPIMYENVTIKLDFGTSQINETAKTSASGMITYNITIPENATRVYYTLQYLGSDIFLSSDLNSSINSESSAGSPGSGGGGGGGGGDNGSTSDPTLDFIFFIILGIISIGLIFGLFIFKSRRREEILKRTLIIKNISHKGTDLLSELLDNFNLQYDVVDLTENVEFPKVENYNLIIIMGHSISIDAFSKKIAKEIEFIKLAFKKRIPIFGIDLGIQFLAGVYGAEMYENSVKEIGFKHNSKWNKVNLTEAGKIDLIFEGIDRSFIVFQVHNETFKITEDLELLATGRYCKNQVIKIGEFNYGFQFHFELTDDLINDFLEHSPYLIDYDKEIILNDFEQIKENYVSRGKQIFTNYLKIIKFI